MDSMMINMGIDMERVPFAGIGNVDPSYVHTPRFVKSHGHVVSDLGENPAFTLKLYSMLKPENVGKRDLEAASDFVKLELASERIEAQLGMGFVILSEDMINVARWSEESPIVPINGIYTYEQGDIRSAQLGDVRELGSFCVWEMAIAGHERKAWMRYLTSNRGRQDKIDYLRDFMPDGRISE